MKLISARKAIMPRMTRIISSPSSMSSSFEIASIIAVTALSMNAKAITTNTRERIESTANSSSLKNKTITATMITSAMAFRIIFFSNLKGYIIIYIILQKCK